MAASVKVLEKLEFNAIKIALAAECTLPGARERAEALAPSPAREKVAALLGETEEGSTLLRLNPLFSLRGAKEIRPALERCLRGGLLREQDLLDIRDTIKAARQIRADLLGENQTRGKTEAAPAGLRAIAAGITPAKKTEEAITLAIGEDARVRDTASEELARCRRAEQTLRQRIRETIDGVLRGPQQKMLQDLLFTTRGDRWVLPVKAEYGSVFPGIVHDQSASGATLYMEPMSVVRLANELRETELKSIKEAERILARLTADVAAGGAALTETYEALLRLDFILAKARYGQKTGGAAPALLREPNISLVKARHPLIARPVPLTLELGFSSRFLVVTGPNTGGKTVALKTIGLMAVMVQCGLFIPAGPESKMGVFSHILIDVGDEQSIEQSLSTFSSHMANIVEILRLAGASSLVLFDEIGAGTDPTEGVALAAAIIGELLRRGSRGVATTHYGALKEFAYNTDAAENASVEFNAETLEPTYRLLVGIPGRSNAFSIARRLGLSEDVLAEAHSFLSRRQHEEAELLGNLEETRRRMELAEERLAAEERAAADKTAKLAKKAEEASARQEEALRQAREQAAEIIREARREAEEAVKEIKEARKKDRRAQEEAVARSRAKLKNYAQTIADGAAVSKDGPRPEQIHPGLTVYLPNMRQRGQIIGWASNGEALIQAGIMKMSVPLREIRLTDETRSPEHLQRTIRGSMSAGLAKAVTLRSEIDLRGNKLDEAIELLDKYLDDAVLTGIHQVSVIHGKGTGALRGGVHAFLRRHPHVSAFRLGEFGEGDTGVTIIELK
ncbi:MAG: endonuclease MutS2 [Gracilibacteraceae bacterium]|nr:endonuclease MutS2 [Gracilibacteraceae bacterium]